MKIKPHLCYMCRPRSSLCNFFGWWLKTKETEAGTDKQDGQVTKSQRIESKRNWPGPKKETPVSDGSIAIIVYGDYCFNF